MTPIQLLSDAITGRNVVSFTYDDKPRSVEPHCLGLGAKGALLRAYQIAGESSSNPTQWKLFTVDKMQDIKINGLRFAKAREGYKKGDTIMHGGIIAEL